MNINFNPQGKIIATGEDGVPWELYENGYLLFKPTKEKDTLTNSDPSPYWKEEYGDKIIAIGFTDTVYAPEDSSCLFWKYKDNYKQTLTKLQYIETQKIDTSNVTDMYSMFFGLNIKFLDLSNWNTSNVTTMESMFEHSLVESLDLSNWDTSNVTNMYRMFCNVPNLQYLNISNWDIRKCNSMCCIFLENPRLQFVDLSQVKVSKQTIRGVYLTPDDVDCTQLKTSNQMMKYLLENLMQLDEIEIPNDCTIVLPDE